MNNNNNNNNNNNPQTGKRKRNRGGEKATSSASSVSSVSTGGGGEDPNDESLGAHKGGSQPPQQQQQQPPPSIFSGFWSDAELEVDDTNHHHNSNDPHEPSSSSVSLEKKRSSRRTTAGGRAQPQAGTGASKTIDYEGFYLTIGDTVYEIGLGDVVAMRNTPTTPDDDEDIRPASEYAADARAELASEYYPAEDEEAAAAAATAAAAAPEAVVPNEPTTSATTALAGVEETAALPPPTVLPPASVPSQAAAATAPAAAVPPPPPVARPREAKRGDGLMLARVERIWKEFPPSKKGHRTNKGRGRVLFEARWFLKKADVDALPLSELTGPAEALATFASRMTEHDLVLSNQSDDNHVTTICDLVQVLYRNPDLDAEMPSLVLPATYICRYSLCIEDDPKVVVLPYTGDNDDWKEMTVSALESRKRRVDDDNEDEESPERSLRQEKEGGDAAGGGHFPQHNLMSPTRRTTGGSGEVPPSSGQKRRRVGDFATLHSNNNDDEEGNNNIDEGTTEQRDIQIGKDHQVYVPAFVPNQHHTIVSRSPISLWKPGTISPEGLDDYLERSAHILSPYLREHHLTQEEPYAPYPTTRMEKLSESLNSTWKRLPTLSSVSSASSLLSTTATNTHGDNALLREFDVDALLRNLHVSNYNVRAAIAAIEASPMDYVVAWSPYEKTLFNTGFRRYSGSLRAIYKGMGSSKSLREVIDYHYRFKIPDQFRRVQERKREQAIRMLECIETKRNINAPIVVSPSFGGGGPAQAGSNGSSSSHHRDPEAVEQRHRERRDWTKTGAATLAVSLEERRAKAKELLLDVEAKLGRNKMIKVLDLFKNADETALGECKTQLLKLFRGHQDFSARFLEFLPQQMRL